MSIRASSAPAVHVQAQRERRARTFPLDTLADASAAASDLSLSVHVPADAVAVGVDMDIDSPLALADVARVDDDAGDALLSLSAAGADVGSSSLVAVSSSSVSSSGLAAGDAAAVLPGLRRLPSLPLSQLESDYGVLRTTDTLLEIVKWLDCASLCCFALTCRDWAIVARDHGVILAVFQRMCDSVVQVRENQLDAYRDIINALLGQEYRYFRVSRADILHLRLARLCAVYHADNFQACLFTLVRHSLQSIIKMPWRRGEPFVVAVLRMPFINPAADLKMLWPAFFEEDLLDGTGYATIVDACASAADWRWVIEVCVRIDRLERKRRHLADVKYDVRAVPAAPLLLPGVNMSSVYHRALAFRQFMTAWVLRTVPILRRNLWDDLPFVFETAWLEWAADQDGYPFELHALLVGTSFTRGPMADTTTIFKDYEDSSDLCVRDAFRMSLDRVLTLCHVAVRNRFAAAHLFLDATCRYFPRVTVSNETRERIDDYRAWWTEVNNSPALMPSYFRDDPDAASQAEALLLRFESFPVEESESPSSASSQ